MPKNHSTIELYDARDVADAYGVACESTQWLSTLIEQIQKEADSLKNNLSSRGIHSAHFYTLESLISIASFMAEDRRDFFDVETERLKEEFEANKKVVTL